MNNYCKKTTEQNLKALSEHPPFTSEEFMRQCEEGCSIERELLREMLAPRVNAHTSPEEKLSIIRTCLVAQFEFHRHNPDYPPDNFVALRQLLQLAMYSKSWDDLKRGVCLYDET